MVSKTSVSVVVFSVILFFVRSILTVGIEPWDVPSLEGKVFVVTGSTGGIGLETAKKLAAWGATVVMANRNLQKSRDVVKHLEGGHVLHRELDLASFASTRAFAASLKADGMSRVDCLILNAGTTMDDGSKSADGVDMQYQVNYLSHFLLANLLVPSLPEGGRVVFVSSLNHYIGSLTDQSMAAYGPAAKNTDPATHVGGLQLYSDTKLMMAMAAVEMSKRHPHVVATSVHPGLVQSDLDQDGNVVIATVMPYVRKLVARTTASGALTQLRVATDPALQGATATGRYFSDHCINQLCVGLQGAPATRNQTLRTWLWDTSVAIVGGLDAGSD